MNRTQQYALLLAWVIAIVAMISTLYASEILNMPVCHLCWYQRICMYPLVIILGMACYREDLTIVSYLLPFPVLGALFALYQYLEQMIPGFAPIGLCGTGPSCMDTPFQWLGFITFPLLSLLANVFIFVLLWMVKVRR